MAATHNSDAEWRAHYEAVLENIKQNIQYKHPLQQRACSLYNCVICSALCCAPCCLYDTVCCSLQRLCGCSCSHGMYCLLASAVIDKTYERTNKVLPVKNSNVSPETVRDVCKKYMIEFDMCVVQRTVKHARMANEIREFLVHIIQMHLKRYDVRDDGDVDKLRKIVFETHPMDD